MAKEDYNPHKKPDFEATLKSFLLGQGNWKAEKRLREMAREARELATHYASLASQYEREAERYRMTCGGKEEIPKDKDITNILPDRIKWKYNAYNKIIPENIKKRVPGEEKLHLLTSPFGPCQK